jgi:hypothetical protein
MKSLKQIIVEESAIKRLSEVEYVDGMDADINTVAEYFVDEVGNLDDTVTIRDFFIKNRITDLKTRTAILKLAKKKLQGK